MAAKLERANIEGSSLIDFLRILDGDKIVIVDCESYSLSIINGSIGNDSKLDDFVNVEVDFKDHEERYRIYPFGVNRVIDSRLGDEAHSTVLDTTVYRSWSLSTDRPVWFMDHSGFSQKVRKFVEGSLESGSVRRFKEGEDFRTYYREVLTVS